jgi:putative membrane protein
VPAILGGAVLIEGIIVAFAVIEYKRYRWELTDAELHIYRGLIVHKRMHVPYGRIHTADINAPLLDRLFGVVTLKMDTAGGSHAQADAQIPGLEMALAERIKDEIFRRKAAAAAGASGMPGPYAPGMAAGVQAAAAGAAGGIAAGAASIIGNVDYAANEFAADVEAYTGAGRAALGQVRQEGESTVYRLSVGELILSAISSASTLVILLIMVGFVAQISQFFGSYQQQFWETVGRGIMRLVSMGAVFVVLFVLVLVIISMAIATVTKVMTLWNFTVRRYGGNIEVRRGLLTKNSSVVAVSRIQAVRVKQGMVRRLFGFAEISIEKVALQNQNEGNKQPISANLVHPFIRMRKVDEFLRAILPEFAEVPPEETYEKLGGAALRRSFFRYIRWSLICLIAPMVAAVFCIGEWVPYDWEYKSLLLTVLVAMTAVLFLYLMITAFFAWRGRAFGYDEKMLVLKSGAYGRRYVYLPRRKIQTASVRQNPFQKWARVATFRAHCASPNMRLVGTIDVEEASADAFIDWVRSYKPARAKA